jgi:hypothetical protein
MVERSKGTPFVSGSPSTLDKMTLENVFDIEKSLMSEAIVGLEFQKSVYRSMTTLNKL